MPDRDRYGVIPTVDKPRPYTHSVDNGLETAIYQGRLVWKIGSSG